MVISRGPVGQVFQHHGVSSGLDGVAISGRLGRPNAGRPVIFSGGVRPTRLIASEGQITTLEEKLSGGMAGAN